MKQNYLENNNQEDLQNTNPYYLEFITFFIKHNLYNEEMFEYIRENSFLIDYREEEKRPLIGCQYTFDKKDRLTRINLLVPIMHDKLTILINIHEYLHAITLYKYLGKKCKLGFEKETLPMLFETIYALENQDTELQNHLNYLNSHIKNEDSQLEYKISLLIQPELLNYYQTKNPSFQKLQHKAKKLTKKSLRK